MPYNRCEDLDHYLWLVVGMVHVLLLAITVYINWRHARNDTWFYWTVLPMWSAIFFVGVFWFVYQYLVDLLSGVFC